MFRTKRSKANDLINMESRETYDHLAGTVGEAAARAAAVDHFDLRWAAREVSMDKREQRRERYVNRMRPIRTLRND